jgi:hypothetical protein
VAQDGAAVAAGRGLGIKDMAQPQETDFSARGIDNDAFGRGAGIRQRLKKPWRCVRFARLRRCAGP